MKSFLLMKSFIVDDGFLLLNVEGLKKELMSGSRGWMLSYRKEDFFFMVYIFNISPPLRTCLWPTWSFSLLSSAAMVSCILILMTFSHCSSHTNSQTSLYICSWKFRYTKTPARNQSIQTWCYAFFLQVRSYFVLFLFLVPSHCREVGWGDF